MKNTPLFTTIFILIALRLSAQTVTLHRACRNQKQLSMKDVDLQVDMPQASVVLLTLHV